MSLTHIKTLDGLRGLAILMVLVWHYVLGFVPKNAMGEDVWQAFSWMWSGVDLFFVLSGFLIGRILIYYKESKNYFKTFYIRRVLRISPPYYLLLLLFFGITAIAGAATMPALLYNSIPAAPYFLYIQNFFMTEGFGSYILSVTWSIAVEEQFYLVLPFVLFFINTKHIPKILIAGIIAAPIFRGLISGNGAYVLLPARMDALLMGVLIAYYYLNGKVGVLLSRNNRLLKGVAALLLAGIVLLALKTDAIQPGKIAVHTLFAIFYGIILLLALAAEKKPSFILKNQLLIGLGKISYTVYLFHQFFNYLFSKLLLNKEIPQFDSLENLWVLLLSLTATVGFAALSYNYFERPLQKIGKRYQY